MLLDFKMNEKDVHLLILATINIKTISGTTNLIGNQKKKKIMLLNGTLFHENDALYFRKFEKNRLNFKHISRNRYYVENYT